MCVCDRVSVSVCASDFRVGDRLFVDVNFCFSIAPRRRSRSRAKTVDFPCVRCAVRFTARTGDFDERKNKNRIKTDWIFSRSDGQRPPISARDSCTDVHGRQRHRDDDACAPAGLIFEFDILSVGFSTFSVCAVLIFSRTRVRSYLINRSIINFFFLDSIHLYTSSEVRLSRKIISLLLFFSSRFSTGHIYVLRSAVQSPRSA